MKKADPKICAVCHRQLGGCCRLGQGRVEKMFGLTPTEVEWIAHASGLAPSQFTVRDEVPLSTMNFFVELHPVFAQIMPGGKRVRLRLTGEGACWFLGPEGCRLPWEARPLYCRLYPMWFTPEGRIMVLINPSCLAQRGASSWREVMKRVGLTEQLARELFSELLALAKAGVGQGQKR